MTTTYEAESLLRKVRGKPITFGDLLVGYRSVEGISQVQLAGQLGISRQTLCDAEKDRKRVSAERAAHWATLLGQSVAVWVEVAIQQAIDDAGLKLRVDITNAA